MTRVDASRLPVRRDASGSAARAFTLIEVLVVVLIIAVLISILYPALRAARNETRRIVCQKQLHQVGTAIHAYLAMFRDSYPDPWLIGRHMYRRAPGEKTPGDRNAKVETYGLAVALDRAGTMSGRSPAWICPDAPRWMVACKNTYAFAYNTPFYDNIETPAAQRRYWDRKYSAVVSLRATRDRDGTKEQTGKFLYGPGTNYPLVWDNYTALPGLTGFMGPFKSSYTIPTDQRFDMPHVGGDITFGKAKHKYLNCLYIDLRVAPRKYE